jgi:hypothetical protein
MEYFLWVADHDLTDHLVYGHHNMLFSAPTLVLDQDHCLEINIKDVQYVHVTDREPVEQYKKF